MKQFKPLQILTLSIFILLLSGFVAYRAGAFDATKKINSLDLNSQLLEHPLKNPIYTDTPTITKDTVRINPNLLPSSKSLLIYDKYTIQKHQLKQEINIDDSLRNALYNGIIDTLEFKKPPEFNYMGTSKSGVIFPPRTDSRIEDFTPKSDPFSIRPDSLEK